MIASMLTLTRHKLGKSAEDDVRHERRLFRALTMLNRAFSREIIKLASTMHPTQDFLPRFFNGYWRSPRFSLRRQADIRKCAIMLGRDPVLDVGLPPLPEKKPLRVKPPKGTKMERTYEERQEKIRKAMEEMPEKVQKWRKEMRDAKEKAKPILPF